MFVENFITIPFINCIELGLQDMGGMLKLGVTRKVVHSNHASTLLHYFKILPQLVFNLAIGITPISIGYHFDIDWILIGYQLGIMDKNHNC